MRTILIIGLACSAPVFADPPAPAPTPAPTTPDTSPIPVPVPVPVPTPGNPEGVPSPVVPVTKNREPVTQELNPYVPWYEGKYGQNRINHLIITASLGVVYTLSETLFKNTLAASSCRWCNPPAFDRDVRNDLVWRNTGLADTLGSINTYVVAPIVGFTLLIVADKDASTSRLIDDTLPVAESIAVAEVATQIIKFSVGRQRPYAHFGDPNAPKTNDDNTSFTSGHSALGFSITASAGLLCHWRGYWTEPYVWASGIVLSLSTEYLRMGADKHYLSDVLTGGLVGIASGLLVPRLMRRDIKIVPIANGAALVRTF